MAAAGGAGRRHTLSVVVQCSADEYRPGWPEPDWLEVHREQKRGKHVTLQLLHLEYSHPSRRLELRPVLRALPSARLIFTVTSTELPRRSWQPIFGRRARIKSRVVPVPTTRSKPSA